MYLRNIFLVALIAFFSTSPFARAQTGSSLFLNGTNGDVQMPNEIWFNGDFTIEAWVYLNAYTPYARLLDFNDGPNTNTVYLALSSGTSGKPQMGVFTNNNSTPTLTSGSTLPLNQWAHLAATLSGTNGTIYIDGIVVASGRLNVPPNVLRTNNFLGKSSYAGDGYAAAAFDDIRLWRGARTQAQIQANMNTRLAGNESGLLAYWRCDQTSGATLSNSTSVGPAYNGTLLGGASWTNSSLIFTTPYALGTTNLLEAPAAGIDSVLVAVNSQGASWTATANAPWLHLAAAYQSGVGSTNLIFTFDANSGATRAATMSIAGQTLTVTQAGSTYVAISSPPVTLGSTALFLPVNPGVDGAGNVYIADPDNSVINEWVRANNTCITLPITGLDSPGGVAVDGAGNVYIADTGNDAIKRWTATNNVVTTLVSSGLNNPADVALDAEGNVYIMDSGNGALRKWNVNLNSVTTLVSSGLYGISTYGSQLAVDSAGNVYMVDSDISGVKEWMPANNSVTTLPIQVNDPSSVAVDGSGNIYIMSLSALTKWKTANNTITTSTNQFSYCEGLALDANGNIYIANTYSYSASLEELPVGFIDPTPKVEGVGAGSDATTVLPATENLLPPFAPSIDQSWLAINEIADGTISFIYSANPGFSNRTANLSLLGETIPITQLGAPTIFGAALSGGGGFEFYFYSYDTNASFTVLSTTNLALPLDDWTVTAAPSEIAPGLFHFTAPSTATDPQRFYRVSSP
jgi:streptogramin lyase